MYANISPQISFKRLTMYDDLHPGMPRLLRLSMKTVDVIRVAGRLCNGASQEALLNEKVVSGWGFSRPRKGDKDYFGFVYCFMPLILVRVSYLEAVWG